MSQRTTPGLPPERDTTAPRRTDQTSPTSGFERIIRVLVLDDDKDTCDVLMMLLSAEEGFACETSTDVATCLKRLREAAAPFDVLLLDLLLPDGHSGLEVVEAARADPSLHLPPIVACTALGDALLGAYRSTLDASGARMITKPFDSETLLAELRAAAGASQH
jgi:CheY-like chemotaxis protein